uniref:Interferon-induced protein 44-like n=1 Tax=Tetraodon nigroviridis TaxID=99883 RepID=H3BYD3_TETNG
PIVFCDIMGLEEDRGHGENAEDIKLILKVTHPSIHLFNPASPLSSDDPYYNPDPSLEDRVHVLVCVLSANMVDIKAYPLDKIKDIREAASDLGIPQVAILTKDEACSHTQKDLKDVYRSKHLKKKMEEFSVATGIPVNCTFPVKNYSEEIDLDDNINALVLSALGIMVQFGDDFIEKI